MLRKVLQQPSLAVETAGEDEWRVPLKPRGSDAFESTKPQSRRVAVAHRLKACRRCSFQACAAAWFFLRRSRLPGYTGYLAGSEQCCLKDSTPALGTFREPRFRAPEPEKPKAKLPKPLKKPLAPLPGSASLARWEERGKAVAATARGSEVGC